MGSDVVRAIVALALAVAGSAGLVYAAPDLREAGLLPPVAPTPAPISTVYTIINVTDDMNAFTACPLDLDSHKAELEQEMRRRNQTPVFSPIADGPGVVTFEFEAQLSEAGCEWDITLL